DEVARKPVDADTNDSPKDQASGVTVQACARVLSLEPVLSPFAGGDAQADLLLRRVMCWSARPATGIRPLPAGSCSGGLQQPSGGQHAATPPAQHAAEHLDRGKARVGMEVRGESGARLGMPSPPQ